MTPAACQKPGGERPFQLGELFRPLLSADSPATAPAPDDSGTAEGQPSASILQIGFDVLRTQAPQGSFSESGKIWNHLDEQVIPAEVAAMLQRNGLRVGRAKNTSWRPIKAILDGDRNVRAFQNSMIMYNGLPLTLELDQQPHDQTVFISRRDETLQGRTFLASMNLIRVEYAVPITDPDSVLVDIMPEIRMEAPAPKLTVDGWMHRPIVPPSEVFRELAARVLIGPDEFLAIGPSAASGRPHTLGALLLRGQVNGQPVESMLFLSPRVTRKPVTPLMMPDAESAAEPAQPR